MGMAGWPRPFGSPPFKKKADLKEGQKSIRRDISRVDRKLERLSNDVGDTLAIVTEATDYEMSKLKEAK